jgi:hypothetical protein
MNNNVKLVVFVPVSHADIVRRALGEASPAQGEARAGKIIYNSTSKECSKL